jgi:hypothetical protein
MMFHNIMKKILFSLVFLYLGNCIFTECKAFYENIFEDEFCIPVVLDALDILLKEKSNKKDVVDYKTYNNYLYNGIEFFREKEIFDPSILEKFLELKEREENNEIILYLKNLYFIKENYVVLNSSSEHANAAEQEEICGIFYEKSDSEGNPIPLVKIIIKSKKQRNKVVEDVIKDEWKAKTNSKNLINAELQKLRDKSKDR